MNAVRSMVCRNVMHYERIRKYVPIDYKKVIQLCGIDMCILWWGVVKSKRLYIGIILFVFDPDGGELSLIYNPAAAWKEYLSSTGV